MIEKITDHNLERYDSRLKEWCDRKFFEKGNYGKYETTEEADAVAFYPAPDTPLKGKVKFSFKETMPANGDKSPDNPSTITGVSSIKVTRCGKNLLELHRMYCYPNRGITASVNEDGSVHVEGTTSNSTGIIDFGNTDNASNKELPYWMNIGKTYTVSLSTNSESVVVYIYLSNSLTAWGSPILVDRNSPVTFTVANDKKRALIRLAALSNLTHNFNAYIQIEEGVSATSFEKPPISEHSISLGNTYYGGEIDLATGVMTVDWEYISVNSFSNCYVNSNTIRFSYNTNFDTTGYVYGQDPVGACNRFAVVPGGDTEFARPTGNPREMFVAINKSRLDVSGAVDPSNPTISEWLTAGNAWLVEHPVVFIAKRANPLTIQLSPTQILSLIQMGKYTPRLNTVYTDADSVQISYLKSPIRDEYEKTQAILSLGGNS